MTNLFSCFNTIVSGLTPIEIIIDEVTTINDCNFIVRPRTEKGWTLDLVFNATDYPWTGDSIFNYWGISGATGTTEYVDNNLSFWLTSDRKIKWKKYEFVDETKNKISSDSTISICTGATTDDFNITITFERNLELLDCDVENSGGVNDQVIEQKVTNAVDTLTGATPIYETIYGLNQKWSYEKEFRFGTLKIYLNGKPIYKLKDWEEVIPSKRGTSYNLVQLFGTGMTEVGNIHLGNCDIKINEINYYEEPLSFIEINNLFQEKENNYNFSSCAGCGESITRL